MQPLRRNENAPLLQAMSHKCPWSLGREDKFELLFLLKAILHSGVAKYIHFTAWDFSSIVSYIIFYTIRFSKNVELGITIVVRLQERSSLLRNSGMDEYENGIYEYLNICQKILWYAISKILECMISIIMWCSHKVKLLIFIFVIIWTLNKYYYSSSHIESGCI